MEPNLNLDKTQAFNLKDLLNDENIKSYQDILGNSGILQNANLESGISQNTNKIISDEERRNILRQKLRAKTNTLRSNRMSKDIKEKTQIDMLKENPMFKNLDSQNNVDMNNIIEKMASSMSKDPKQKKNIKKQISNIVEKMKT